MAKAKDKVKISFYKRMRKETPLVTNDELLKMWKAKTEVKKEEPKPEPKVEIKPEVKEEPKVEVKPETKTE